MITIYNMQDNFAYVNSQWSTEELIICDQQLGCNFNKYLKSMNIGFQVEINKFSNINDRESELLTRLYEKIYSGDCYECIKHKQHIVKHVSTYNIFPSIDSFEEGKKALEWINNH